MEGKRLWEKDIHLDSESGVEEGDEDDEDAWDKRR